MNSAFVGCEEFFLTNQFQNSFECLSGCDWISSTVGRTRLARARKLDLVEEFSVKIGPKEPKKFHNC